MKNKYSDASYDAAIAQLFARVPSFQEKGADAYKPGLERMAQMCLRMGNPQRRYRIIHVAGTNGKGSVCNMLAAQFASGGCRVGLYTSPHLFDFRERMRVVESSAISLISREQVWDFLQEWGPDIDELELSFFEITTVMAFDYFAQRKVDLVVLETGLGGRLDATNVAIPEISVITNIGLDHMDLLGSTLPEIAYEKAGIIKSGVPVVVGESNPLTDPVFDRVALLCGSPLEYADKLVPAGMDEAGFEKVLDSMDLRGSYQSKNLRTVLCALSVLGIKPDFDALCNAARICDFHGRWETVSDKPRIISDIGHNAHGLKYNFAQLDSMLDSGEISSLVMLYGSVKDKDVDASLRLLPSRAHVIVTQASSPRAMPAEQVVEHCRRLGVKAEVEAVPDVAQALDVALRLVGTSDGGRPLLYIGGSTYVVSEVLKALTLKINL